MSGRRKEGRDGEGRGEVGGGGWKERSVEERVSDFANMTRFISPPAPSIFSFCSGSLLGLVLRNFLI